MFVRAGVTKIRLTGGEPTVRRDLPEVVAALSALRPLGLEEISMTTNGIALKRMLPALQAARLCSVVTPLPWLCSVVTPLPGLCSVVTLLPGLCSVVTPLPRCRRRASTG